MITAADLADAARTGAGLPSFYRLARVLGVKDATVANWRHGRATPDDAMTVRLAGLAGLDPAEALAAMNAQRCTDATLRAVWTSIAARLRTAGAAAAAVILSVLFSWTPDADARENAGAPVVAPAHLAQFTGYTLARIAHVFGAVRQMVRGWLSAWSVPCST